MTVFVNDACDQVSVRERSSARVPEMYRDIPNVTSISEYFSRPISVFSGNFSGSPYALFTQNVTNQWIQSIVYNFNRVKGAFGWRANLVFRLQVVATPFQAGIIRLAWSPFENPNILNYERTNHVCAISQLPGVELNLADQTSCVLKVPFIHALNYFLVVPDSNSARESLGAISIFPYLGPDVATGDTQIACTLWFSMEDVELIGSAPTEYVAQSGKIVKNKTADSTSKEAAEVPGNLSNVLAAGSNLMTWAAQIPFLTAIAGKASWALRQGANIAAAYGWSRPLTALPVTKVWHTQGNYQSNCDGVDVSHSLGLFADNAVEVLPGFAGSNVDEMSIDYIKGVYAAIFRGVMQPTNESGAVLYACRLSPSAMYYQDAGGGNYKNISIETTFPAASSGLSLWPAAPFALAQCHRNWRGGFKFRVKMSKTRFHTGRLVVGFLPTEKDSIYARVNIPLNITSLQYSSLVWDIREGSSIEFEVPFTSPYSYLNFKESFGTFFIGVVEPLKGPPTVSTDVSFIVEVCGANDFEVAKPQEVLFPPAPLDTLFVAQSGLMPRSVDADLPARHCIGEKILSIKQLLARATAYGIQTSSGSNALSNRFIAPTWAPNAMAPTSLNSARYDYITYFLAFFGLMRGGTCYHAFANGHNITITALSAPSGASAPTIGPAMYSEIDGAIHVKAPFYGETSRLIIGAQSILPYSPGMQLLTSKLTADTNSEVIYYRRAADDFQLGYYLGTPPLAIPFETVPTLSSQIYTALSTAR